MKQVIEIIARCAEGTCVSRPFRVRADDGSLYWIKGMGTGWNRNELCYELLCAKLAAELELPVAGFDVLEVPEALLEFCAVPGIRDLSAGPAFGSLYVDDASSLLPVEVSSVPQELRWQILLFDWWVQNEDRTLGEKGGNVNLLWNPVGRALTIIDHNNAFDPEFNDVAFFEHHVFREKRSRIPAPFLLEQKQRFGNMAGHLDDLIKAFPDEWVEQDERPGDFAPETVRAILSRFDRLLDVFGGQA
ncbi:HipA family kinase [Pontiella sp.]|uniref:HipA family kinase n=1 Tax=Pontiella sp. TaxID=2837462 RepID=UPI0035684925